MSRWFRLYSEAMRNPKIARLSDRDFRTWVQLLAMAAENEGTIPPLDDLKHLLNARLDHLSSALDRLISGGLIDVLEVGYCPHNWKKRQYNSDTSTERVKKHRAKGNVSETPPDPDPDTETDNRPDQTQSEAPQKVGRSVGPSNEFLGKMRALVRIEHDDLGPIEAAMADGATEADVLEGIRRALAEGKSGPFRRWSAFSGWIHGVVSDRRAKNGKSNHVVATPDGPLVSLVNGFRMSEAELRKRIAEGPWFKATMGPKPGEPGCLVPEYLLKSEAA